MCGDKCRFRHVEAEEKPSKKSKKSAVKGSSALFKESAQLVSLFQDTHLRKSILRKEGKLGGTKKTRENGPSRGITQKCERHERSPCATTFEERSQEETLHQERCARRAAWDL